MAYAESCREETEKEKAKAPKKIVKYLQWKFSAMSFDL